MKYTLPPHQYLICLGSNWGNYIKQLALAQDKLKQYGTIIKSTLPMINPPIGYLSQPHIANQCLILESKLSPQTLLSKTQTIELELNRNRSIHWGPRTIDIDIILFANQSINESNLVIPHPALDNREYLQTLTKQILND